MVEKIAGQSASLAQEQVELLAQLFPSCVVEVPVKEAQEEQCREATTTTAAASSQHQLQLQSPPPQPQFKRHIDLNKLAQLLGQEQVPPQAPAFEGFGFAWAGKRAAIAEANQVIDKTLRPCLEESVDFAHTHHLYLEGDNLDALKLLLRGYSGAVKMIYIDPPYNTGSDFVYNDSFAQSQAEYERLAGISDEQGQRFVLNRNSDARFHSKWCSMIQPRLMLARQLLTPDGLIFISIDDHEMHRLRCICDEIFGENNFIACFPRVTKKSGKSTDAVANNHDYMLLYAKSDRAQLSRQEQDTADFKLSDEHVATRGHYHLKQTLDYNSLGYNASLDYPIEIAGQVFYPGSDPALYAKRQAGQHAQRDWAWRWSKALVEFGLEHGFVVVKNQRIYTKTYERATIVGTGTAANPYRVEYKQRLRTPTTLDYTDNAYSNDNAKKGLKALFADNSGIFEYSKPCALVQSLVSLGTTPHSGDIVLDFFSGSATTAEAVLRANAADGGNRRFVLVQLPERCEAKSAAAQAGFTNICEIGKERIRKVIADLKNNCTKIVHGGGKTAFISGLSPLEVLLEDSVGALADATAPEAEDDRAVRGDNASLAAASAAQPALDLGFRVFKLDSSNKTSCLAVNDYQQSLLSQFESRFKADRSDLDLFFGCLLDYRLPLDRSFATIDLAGHTAYVYDHGELLACFAEDIDVSFVEAVAALPEPPLRVVLNERCFVSSEQQINLSERFKTLLPQVELKVL